MGSRANPVLFTIDSIRFPSSFPYDFMHLIWEGVVKALILLWTGCFKGIGEGKEEYQIDPMEWKKIGSETARQLQKPFLLHLVLICQTLLTASPTSVLTCGPSGFLSLVLLFSRIASGIQNTSSILLTLFLSSISVFNGKSPRRRLIGLRKGFEDWVKGYQE
jgi:hypothetical protein